MSVEGCFKLAAYTVLLENVTEAQHFWLSV